MQILDLGARVSIDSRAIGRTILQTKNLGSSHDPLIQPIDSLSVPIQLLEAVTDVKLMPELRIGASKMSSLSIRRVHFLEALHTARPTAHW